MSMTTLTTDVKRDGGVSFSDSGKASSAHARLNIPLNLENWRTLPPELQQELLWFHQHSLDAKLSLKDAGNALDYDESVIFRVLKGTYEGNWKNIADAIKSYRKLTEQRGQIQQNEFVHNSITKLIWDALDYALANNSVTIVIGESRQGKTASAKAWKIEHNHGRGVFVIAPAYGGLKALLREIAAAVGVNKNLKSPEMFEAVIRAFNKNRLLMVDEAHRLLPGDRRNNAAAVEVLRDIHDRTGCGLAFFATERFDTELKKGSYMFEQLVGRVGMPVRLPRKIKETDVEPIVRQYVTSPGKTLMEVLTDMANKPGRLGILVETLKIASRIARKKAQKLNEAHVFIAIKLREQMQGELVYAK